MILILFPLLLGLFLWQEPSTKEPPRPPLSERIALSDPLLQVGEDLEYRVSYSFFTVGTIRIQIAEKTERNGREIYRVQAIIDSNPSLSWLVDLHIRFYSDMDGEIFSYEWIGDDSTKNAVLYRRLLFAYDSNRVYFERGKKFPSGERKPESVDTVRTSEPSQD